MAKSFLQGAALIAYGPWVEVAMVRGHYFGFTGLSLKHYGRSG